MRAIFKKVCYTEKCTLEKTLGGGGNGMLTKTQTAGRALLLNPGSCGPRRFNQEITMAVLTAGDQGEILEEQRIDNL